MERPALQRLLGDINRGLIDVVVVYKVDRLTRALADFAKIVEVFDAWRLLRGRHTAVQYDDFDGKFDAQRPAVLRPVRAGGDGGTDPRQNCGLQTQRDVDGRCCATGVQTFATVAS